MARRDRNETRQTEGSDTFQRKPLTDDQRARYKAKREEDKEKRRLALIVARKFLGDEGVEVAELKLAITDLIGRTRIPGIKRERGPNVMSVNYVILAEIEAAGDAGLSEMEVFTKFKLGRPDMAVRMRQNFLRKPAPEDRIWISLSVDDDDAGVYRIAGRGATPPDGWTGFDPGKEDTL